jgi:ABC-type uncharacterized transport system substrate-binding protein
LGTTPFGARKSGVDIIVTEGTVAVRAAAAASATIPIVTASAADPFIGGLVKNLSPPRGNITGFAAWSRIFRARCLEYSGRW